VRQQPLFLQRLPFFSSVFRCPFAIGCFFIFTVPADSSNAFVGHVVEAGKPAKGGVEDDHPVTVNVFDSFNNWPGNATTHPIQDGLGENPQEVVITSKLAELHFDRGTRATQRSCLQPPNCPNVELSSKAQMTSLCVAAARMKTRSKMENLFFSLQRFVAGAFLDVEMLLSVTSSPIQEVSLSGASIPLDECMLPQRFLDILRPDEPASIKTGDRFDHEHLVFLVAEVHEENVRVRPAFWPNKVSIAFAQLHCVIDATERKRSVFLTRRT
jgi:hypothetical protein